MGRSLALRFYLLFASLADGWARRTLENRVARGLENPAHLPERLGRSSLPRPDGPLIWIHASNLDENQPILELARRLLAARPDLCCLITTGPETVKVEGWLSERMLHQYIPHDTNQPSSQFIEHWKPDLAVWTDGSSHPVLMCNTHKRNIPMVLINARMSGGGFRRWNLFHGMAASLLNQFDHVMAHDGASAQYLHALGLPSEKTSIVGSLKEGAAPLTHNDTERKALARVVTGRTVWLAASTHAGEELGAAVAHGHARRAFPELLLIIAPRHPERGDEIARALHADGWVVAQRSKGQAIEHRTDIYLADTFGEMGLWYRLAPVSFIGGSLVEVGGHNPFEPAALGSAILHGPHVFNFAEGYARLGKAGAVREVENLDALGPHLEKILAPEQTAALAAAAWEVSSDGAEVTDTVLEMLLTYFPKAGI